MSKALAGSKSPALPDRALVLVPLGSIEQHGPHLPLDTDTAIASAVAQRAADLLDEQNIVVAPPISYGASGEHQSFAGTSSIGSEVLQQVIVELTRSMRTWCSRVVFVNAHGGNLTALSSAVGQLVAEGHDVSWVACATEAVDAHAGFTETSLMLHLQPWAVRLDLAEAGNTLPLRRILPELKKGGVAAVSSNGVLGDPAGASSDEGKRVLVQMVDDVASVIRSGEPDARGCLRVVERSR
ncbi:MAG: creatininase [Marmoricola sp.]|nr:creatininase [Marmoricola sp.]